MCNDPSRRLVWDGGRGDCPLFAAQVRNRARCMIAPRLAMVPAVLWVPVRHSQTANVEIATKNPMGRGAGRAGLAHGAAGSAAAGVVFARPGVGHRHHGWAMDIRGRGRTSLAVGGQRIGEIAQRPSGQAPEDIPCGLGRGSRRGLGGLVRAARPSPSTLRVSTSPACGRGRRLASSACGRCLAAGVLSACPAWAGRRSRGAAWFRHNAARCLPSAVGVTSMAPTRMPGSLTQ